MKKRRACEIVLLIGIACVMIFYRFNRIPQNLDYDEVDFAKLALSLDHSRYSPFSPLATGHATLYFYILLFSFKLGGVSNFTLRFPSAIFGVVNIIIFYLIMQYVNKKTAFFSTFIFATLRWYFTFARFSYEATFLLFLELCAVYFLIRFMKNQKTCDMFALSFFSGLAFNSYTSGRIFFVVPLIILGIGCMRQHIKKIKSMLLALAIFFLTILPLFSYVLTHKDSRFDTQFFFKSPRYTVNQKIRFFTDGIVSTVLMFHVHGDVNGRHNYPGKPALNPVLGLLFVLGFLGAIIRWKNRYNQLFLIYFFTALFPTLLTYPHENPHMLRTFGVIPSVIYFSVAGFELIISRLKMLHIPYQRCAMMILTVYILFLSSFSEIKTYFIYQRIVVTEAFKIGGEIKQILKSDIDRL
ncbi:MAG TPA: glycosyltransferase family 39 protein [Patescibacteria group bacterium]|nr:glycosyltransferase family 39 protein [Patescibacteria group bacterium]